MTPIETKRYLEWIDRNRHVMEAFAVGSKVQVRSSSCNAWSIATGPAWTTEYEYRVKPEPTPRPYTDAELKEQVGKVVIEKANGERATIAWSDRSAIYISGTGTRDAICLLDGYMHVDGSPCGVTE